MLLPELSTESRGALGFKAESVLYPSPVQYGNRERLSVPRRGKSGPIQYLVGDKTFQG